jgi:hypothetical protein
LTDYLSGENKMKPALICCFSVLFLFCFCNATPAADEVKKTSDKSVAASIGDNAKEVKKEIVKTVSTSKEAIVRDAKSMKEDIPRGLKESRDEAVKQSKEFKEGAKKEIKEIRDNLANPSLKPKSESK